jgi:hypothetical protein
MSTVSVPADVAIVMGTAMNSQLGSETIEINFKGPYRLYEGDCGGLVDADWQQMIEKHNSPGVYAWEIRGKNNPGFRTYWFGKTQDSVAKRTCEHIHSIIGYVEEFFCPDRNQEAPTGSIPVAWDPSVARKNGHRDYRTKFENISRRFGGGKEAFEYLSRCRIYVANLDMKHVGNVERALIDLGLHVEHRCGPSKIRFGNHGWGKRGPKYDQLNFTLCGPKEMKNLIDHVAAVFPDIERSTAGGDGPCFDFSPADVAGNPNTGCWDAVTHQPKESPPRRCK